MTPIAIGYWCTLNEEGKKKKQDEKGRKQKEKEEMERKKKKKEKQRGKKEKDKVKETGKGEKEKVKGDASAGKVGFGISIFSHSVGGASAGVGISVGSTSAAFGTAGAGISWFSDTAAAGAVGAGVSTDSMGAGVGVAGAGITQDSESIAAGAAGAGKSKGATTAGAGVAGAGKVEDSQSAAAGTAGTGEVKDSTTASAGSVGSGKQKGVTGAGTGSPKKPIDPKEVKGPDADKVPEGKSDAEVTPHKEGKPSEAAGQTDKPAAGDVPGAPSDDKEGGSGIDAEGPQKAPGKTPGDKPSAGGSKVDLGVGPVFPWGASDADREWIGEEAAKVAVMVQNATPAQKLLLQHLATTNPTGRYMIPTAEWANKLLRVTADLTPEEIEFIKNLDWKPGSISEEELRERLRKALAKRDGHDPIRRTL